MHFIMGTMVSAAATTTDATNHADTAWILASSALVLLMTPGLAFFYGGMVNRKNVISTMIKSVVAAGIVGVLWIVVGFSLSFGDSIGGFIAKSYELQILGSNFVIYSGNASD